MKNRMSSLVGAMLALVAVHGAVAQAPAKPALAIAQPKVSPAATEGAAQRDQPIELSRLVNSFAAQLIPEFMATGRFQAVARSDMDALQKEQDFTGSGNVDPNDPEAAQPGRIKGSRLLLVTTIDDFQDRDERATFPGVDQAMTRRTVRLTASATLYDSSTGAVQASVSGEGSANTVLADPSGREVRGGSVTEPMVREVAVALAKDLVKRVVAALPAEGAMGGAGGAGSVAEQSVPDRPLRTAVFVKDRAAVPADKVMVMNDFIVAGLDPRRFAVMSREDLLNAVARFAIQGENAGTESDPEKQLDRILSDEANALSLARAMGADAMLLASLSSYQPSSSDFKGQGIESKATTWTLTVTYRLTGVGTGLVYGAGVAQQSSIVRETPGLKQEVNPLDGLIQRCGAQVAQDASTKAATSAAFAAAASPSSGVVVRAVMQDLRVPGIFFDQSNGQYVVSRTDYDLAPVAATVEVDGFVIGQHGQPLDMTPGPHKVRVSGSGFETWERNVLVKSGMQLEVGLRMTPEAFARWQEQTAFLEGLKRGQALNDAEVDRIRAMADFIRNSRMVIDQQSDINVDTNEAPTLVPAPWWPFGGGGAVPVVPVP
ncbi:MAG: PEGA domain-containing protein [Planctomycetes bacterium]|nr:PEGA domain-containing protein [Planctomycetota bacterium]